MVLVAAGQAGAPLPAGLTGSARRPPAQIRCDKALFLAWQQLGQSVQAEKIGRHARSNRIGRWIKQGCTDMPPDATLRAMSIALTKPWTVEQFLAWAAHQEARYEFDGRRPVAMTGGSANHSRITLNIHGALRTRLRGTPCSSFGPDLGLRTIGNAIRYPDALVTCTKFAGTERLAPDPVVVFEVLSADSGRRDRIEKVREYAAVASILYHVIVESSSSGLLVLHRQQGDAAFTALTLTSDDILSLPEIGVQVPVAEFYEDVDLADA
jgi:Uma2 family endonuclease